MKKITVLIAFAAVLSSCSLFGGKKAENAAEAGEAQEAAEAVVTELPKVTVTSVFKEKVLQSGTYTSTVQAYVVNNIAPQTANRIKSINVEIGDFVSKGQLLAKMDVANLEQVKLQLVNDSTELVRIKGLYEVGGVSKSDLDAITLAYNVRKTTYENLLENTELRSPISGVVTARNYDKGDMYSMAQPLYTIQQITPVKLLVSISESDYTKVKKGDKVTLTADALPGESFDGSIDRIYPIIDATTHTFTVEVKVSNYNKRLRPGMYARVTVNFGVNNSVVVPDKAVVRQQGAGDKFIYVLNEDNTVTFTKVILGTRMGDRYEVLEGIEDGARIVTEGQIRIKDGVEVNAVEEEDAAEAAE